MFEIKKDRIGAALEVIPNNSLNLSMTSTEKKLIGIGYQSIVLSPFMLVVKREEEFTIFPSGKIVVSSSLDKIKLKELATEIYQVIG